MPGGVGAPVPGRGGIPGGLERASFDSFEECLEFRV